MGVEVKTYDCTPEPSSLLESNRNLGYSLPEAISDLVDNSISAGAQKISFEINWNEGAPNFILKDDGCGMSDENNELLNSLRLGSKNPLEEREPSDLGRFGFGMKTASLSQSRRLSVMSKRKGGKEKGLTLDLDFIAEQGGKWLVYEAVPENHAKEFNFLREEVESGTVVRWDAWDRAPLDEKDFNSLATEVINHLSVCFHRYLEKGISIMCRDEPISPTSPIPYGEGAQLYSEASLEENLDVRLRAFVLQHPKKWMHDYENVRMFNSFCLFNGFQEQQGIYIYRCNRLLNPHGSWLGMHKATSSSKLARVVIDYPNNADTLWSLDITKTNATIPYSFRREIKNLINITRRGSQNKVIRGNRRTTRALDTDHSSIWRIETNSEINAFSYRLNNAHPLFHELVHQGRFARKDLEYLFELIADNLPIAKIIDNNDENPSMHDRSRLFPELTERDLNYAEALHSKRLSEGGSKQASISWILSLEPFCYHEREIKQLLQ